MKGYIFCPYFQGGRPHTPLFNSVAVDVISYNLPVGLAATSITGEIEIAGDLPQEWKYRAIRLDNFPNMLWRIASFSSSDGATTRVTVTDALSFLADGFIPETEYNSIATFADLLERAIPAPADPTQPLVVGSSVLYGVNNAELCKRPAKASGAVLTKINNTPLPAFDEINSGDGSVTVESVARYMVSRGFTFDNFRFSQEGHREATTTFTRMFYIMELGAESFGTAQAVPFSDGHSFLSSASFVDDVCTLAVVGSTTFQLNADGSVSVNLLRQNQLPGYVRYSYAPSSMDITERTQIAEAIFAENKTDHKVEFMSDRSFAVGQPVRLIFDNFVFDSTISSIRVKSDDNRYQYTCGEMPVTGAEKIRNNEWSYGRRLPNTPRKGELYFKR